MTVVTLAGLRRIVGNLEGLPGDVAVDLGRLDRRGSALVYDRGVDVYIDIRFDLEDLVDD